MSKKQIFCLVFRQLSAIQPFPDVLNLDMLGFQTLTVLKDQIEPDQMYSSPRNYLERSKTLQPGTPPIIFKMPTPISELALIIHYIIQKFIICTLNSNCVSLLFYPGHFLYFKVYRASC